MSKRNMRGTTEYAEAMNPVQKALSTAFSFIIFGAGYSLAFLFYHPKKNSATHESREELFGMVSDTWKHRHEV